MNEIAVFPYPEWVESLKVKLNTDEKYARIARNWEGDLRFILEPDSSLKETVWIYFDLWHGKCRDAYIEENTSPKKPTFQLTAPYGNFVKILSGETGPMQALMSRMLGVKGNFAYFMRNVPTVLDFVRCCQEITKSWL